MPTAETHAARILVLLYLLEASSLLALVGVHEGAALDRTLLATGAGATLALGIVGLAACAWLLVRQIAGAGPSRGRAVRMGLATNLVTGLGALLLSEGALRAVARRSPDGIDVRSVHVRSTWPEIKAQSRKVLSAVAPWGTWDASFFVYDRELGWTVGPNRHSPDGLYFSSVEGLRSARPDERLSDSTAPLHVALVGDSQAFSFEVPYQDSWGSHLQHLLGPEVQVLNFGVDGYGIDQMYLHYLRDVRPFKPQVVLIGFSGHDLRRTMAVYPPVSFGWPGYVVKPRFALEDGRLRLLNVPLPTPEQVLDAGSVGDLPFARYDLGYATTRLCWTFDHAPLLLRYLATAFPSRADPLVAPEPTKDLNGRLFAELVGAIERDGAVPLVVLMMSRNELVPDTLARAHLPYLDMTECVAGVRADLRTVPSGNHYTGLGNQAIARCTAPAVERALRRPARGSARPAA